MASSTIEQVRQALEDVDRLETGIVDCLSKRTRTHIERLETECQIAACLDLGRSLASNVLTKLADADGLLREERATMTQGDVFSSFYSRLRDIREYHAKFAQDEELVKRTVMSDVKPVLEFSGEESYGRFLDLHELHEQYLNLPGITRVDYKTYLDHLSKFDELPERTKSTQAFKQYLGDLVRYLYGFVKRAKPLVDVDGLLKDARTSFSASKAPAAGVTDAQLTSAPSAAALEAFGPDALKIALAARGLKSGGTLKDRAERLFAIKGLTPDQYPKKLLGKPAEAAEATPAYAAGIPETHGLAGGDVTEWLLSSLSLFTDMLSDTIAESRARVLKKQTRTLAELAAEMEAEAEVVVESSSESESDEEKPIYNPKNLPLGWDGKPIPYWLYKLHGLNQEFVCEICGDYSYWGRRNFDRHFQEPRHAYGMRRLGIPNTKHFHDVTGIKDAMSLYQKLREGIEAEAWRPEAGEEFEDTEGNVMSRKTYEDLARQGLL